MVMLNKACHQLPSDAALRKSWIIAIRRLPVRIRIDTENLLTLRINGGQRCVPDRRRGGVRVLCTLRTVRGLGSLCRPKIFEIFGAIVGCVT